VMTPFAVAGLLVVAAVLVWAWRVRLAAVHGRRRAAAANPQPPAAADAPNVARGSSAPTSRPAPLINPHALARMHADLDPNHLATCRTLWDLPDAHEPGGGHG